MDRGKQPGCERSVHIRGLVQANGRSNEPRTVSGEQPLRKSKSRRKHFGFGGEEPDGLGYLPAQSQPSIQQHLGRIGCGMGVQDVLRLWDWWPGRCNLNSL